MSLSDRVFTVLLVTLAIVLAVSLIRNRRVSYRDIKEAEVNPDVAAGEELLQDVMMEGERHAERTTERELERR
jgi:hypothetical protein